MFIIYNVKHNYRLVNGANPLPIISIMDVNQKKIVLRFRDNSKHFYQRLKDDNSSKTAICFCDS